jgi:hypothetical protein
MCLVSSITVDEVDCGIYLDTILDVLNDVTLEWMHDSNDNAGGDYNNTWLPMLVPEESVCVDGDCTFSLYEPIGSVGWTDDAGEVYTPPATPGPGKGSN